MSPTRIQIDVIRLCTTVSTNFIGLQNSLLDLGYAASEVEEALAGFRPGFLEDLLGYANPRTTVAQDFVIVLERYAANELERETVRVCLAEHSL